MPDCSADAWPCCAPMLPRARKRRWLINDLLTGAPMGLPWSGGQPSAALEVIDRRRCGAIIGSHGSSPRCSSCVRGRAVAGRGGDGAAVRFTNVAPSILVGIVCFPIAAFVVLRLDLWRMGR